MIRLLKENSQGVCLYEMKSSELTVLISSFGVTIVEIEMKDRIGNKDNIVLGYPALADYEARPGTYFGATVGRVCNRIAKGEFTLNGSPYTLAVNNGPNSLHGGIDGFSYQNFQSEIVDEDTLHFFYRSDDMEEGYPGTLELSVYVTLKNDTLTMQFAAESDKDTLINITNHTYFNLNGAASDVTDHILKIEAERFGCVDGDGLATGQFRETAGSCFDFTEGRRIRDALDFSDDQVSKGNGIDHHFVFRNGCETEQLSLSDESTGRKVTLTTTLPGAQIYTGNYIGECEGRRGRTYGPRFGVAIEPQYMPDSIHNEADPAVILRASEPYEESLSYTFTVE